jgi:copper oxidase (laccase) domain-containing protein
MTPELKYVNSNIEVCIFGKSLKDYITEKIPEKQLMQQKEFLSNYFKIPQERIFFLEQVHGFDCIHINEYDLKLNQKLLYHKADGMITGLKNVLLCIRTADCLPLFFHTNPYKENKFIGILHAGWRGIYRGIITNSLQLMKHNVEKMIYEYKVIKKLPNYEEKIGYPITVFPGIYIPSLLYEVDWDIAQLFPVVKPKNNENKFLLDLWKNTEFIIKSIKDIQFQIEDPFHYLNGNQIDFYKNFYSHRRGEPFRNLNVIYLK